MSDDEFDPEWKPNGRPQSTLARSFSAALHDAFMIDTSIDSISAAVEEKKRAVSTRNQELEALEARLRETEERLKKSRTGSPHSRHNSPHQRTPLGSTFATAEGTPTKSQAPEQPRSRPPPVPKAPSYAAPPIPGGLPPTPGEEGSDTTATASGDPSSTSEGSQ